MYCDAGGDAGGDAAGAADGLPRLATACQLIDTNRPHHALPKWWSLHGDAWDGWCAGCRTAGGRVIEINANIPH